MRIRRFSLLLMLALLVLAGISAGCGDSNPSADIPSIPTVSPPVVSPSASSASELRPSYQPKAPTSKPPRISARKSTLEVAKGTATESFSVASGWTLVSFPFQSLQSVSGLDYELSYFDGMQYAYLNPNTDKVDTTQAYWIYSDNAGTVTATGTTNADGALNQMSLHSGWNLVGCPSTSALPFANMSVTRQGGSTKTILDAATDSMNPGDSWMYRMVQVPVGSSLRQVDLTQTGATLTPKAGHWVFAWSDLTINLNVVKPAALPSISSLSAANLSAGDVLVVSGSNLGDITTGLVTINGLKVPAENVSSWTSSAIRMTVPSGVTSGNLTVFVNLFPSNSKPVTVGSQGTFKSITGVVEDRDTAKALVGAQVMIDTGHFASSDINGEFSIYDVPAGEHAVYVVMIGYKTAYGIITLESGTTRTVHVALSSAVSGSTGGDDAEETGFLRVKAYRKDTSNDAHRYWVSRIQISEQGNYSKRWSNTWSADELYRELTADGAVVGRTYNIKVDWEADDGWEKTTHKSVTLTSKDQTESIYSW